MNAGARMTNSNIITDWCKGTYVDGRYGKKQEDWQCVGVSLLS
jgi:hypothetical protein